MNMVIGTFFSEVGGDLLKMFLQFEKNEKDLRALVFHDRRWARQGLFPAAGPPAGISAMTSTAEAAACRS